MLDELTTAGEVLWTGHGSLAGDDGWIALHLAETAPLTIPLPDGERCAFQGELHRAILDMLGGGGAFFFRPLAEAVAARRCDPAGSRRPDRGFAGARAVDDVRPSRTPCGTWCSPAWSAATRWRRCGPG